MVVDMDMRLESKEKVSVIGVELATFGAGRERER